MEQKTCYIFLNDQLYEVYDKNLRNYNIAILKNYANFKFRDKNSCLIVMMHARNITFSKLDIVR